MATLNLDTAAELDIVTPHSYPLSVELTFLTEADEPIALEGSFKLMATRNRAGQRPLLTLETGNGITATGNKLMIEATKEQMQTIPAGEYYYDIRNTTGEAEQRVFAGKLIVNHTQTK